MHGIDVPPEADAQTPGPSQETRIVNRAGPIHLSRVQTAFAPFFPELRWVRGIIAGFLAMLCVPVLRNCCCCPKELAAGAGSSQDQAGGSQGALALQIPQRALRKKSLGNNLTLEPSGAHEPNYSYGYDPELQALKT